MVRFTIMAEYKAEPFIQWMQNHVDPTFPGSTLAFHEGRWEGKTESSFSLTVLVPGTLHDLTEALSRRPDGVWAAKDNLLRLAETYRVMANQSEVWVTQEDIGVTRVTNNGNIEQ